MCNFFSFLSDGNGSYIYADWELRQKILKGEIKADSNQGADSHSWLAKHFIKNGAEDKYNKYEYNPLTRVFTVDQINTEDDRASAEKWCNELDWKRIVKPLVVKPITYPLRGKAIKPTALDKKLMRELALVWASVGDSVWDSVRASVGSSVGESVWESVWDSMWDSVRASVGNSVWSSVWSSVLAYHGSFYNIEFKVNITPSNRLWERGFVVSFDGTTYRLHSGENEEVVWAYKPS
jgi:hypothetical protein